MSVSDQILREAAADIALSIAEMTATSGEAHAQVLRPMFLGMLEARVPSTAAEPAPAPPPVDPNAEGEALAAEIVASAAGASGETAANSEAYKITLHTVAL